MDTKDLMSGIAVVIDDALDRESISLGNSAGGEDVIVRIVEWFEHQWELPFAKFTTLPNKAQWSNLLRAASFVLLDWQLWPVGSEELRKSTIEDINRFLKAAKENLVPVFIFTNETFEEVTENLSADVYEHSATRRNFVFVARKDALWFDDSVQVKILEDWIHGNASVYALRTWEQVLASAKSELFQAMGRMSVDWPRVFWSTYVTDGAEPSPSLTNLIGDSLRGRMRSDAFEEEHLGAPFEDVSDDEVRKLIAETSFRSNKFLPGDEIRCGDVFKGTQQKYWLNLRPDCDCIPRGTETIEDVEIYCVQGKKAGERVLHNLFDRKTGNFNEPVYKSVAFAIADGNSLVFNFKKLRVMKFSDFKKKRIGRLLHPYLTRIQQQYALYIQRQALPRVPDSAVPTPKGEEHGEGDVC